MPRPCRPTGKSPVRLWRWGTLAVALGAAIAGCTAINDADVFVIASDPLRPAPLDDCRQAGVARRCEGDVPQRCSVTGVWENDGPACTGGCSDGSCHECTPGALECAEVERLRRECSASGRWVNAEPCGRDAPHCVAGECLACLPGERTCIDGIPSGCDPDGRWRAEAACPANQGCVFETGECHACAGDEVRPCRGARGTCATGISLCQPDGSWSPCSISPVLDDCSILGDDASCDGIPNSPPGGCEVGCSADILCGPPASRGICRTGISRCVDGAPQECEGAIWPQARDCRSRDDNDCNGIPDYLDDTCRCDATDREPQPCATWLYGDEGICESPVRRCVVAAGGTQSYWGECTGGVAPQPRDCSSDDDNDCDGLPDSASSGCGCEPGASQPCQANGCGGIRSCVVSSGGDTSSWGECELSSEWLFSAPERLSGLGLSGDQWGPASLPPEGLALLFSAGNPEHIYIASSRGGAAYDAAVLLAGINGSTTEGTPFVTASGQTLYFDSRRRAGSGRDLWRAAATPTGWTTPELVPGVNSAGDDQNAWLSLDERTLVFNSDRGGDMDLWAAVSNGGALGAPFPLDELNSDASDEGATLTLDGRAIFFASNRPGGSGDLDVWVATRRSVDEAFGIPRNLAAVNSSEDELDLALSPDGSELFFSSSRSGAYQLYRAARGCAGGVALGARGD